MRALALVPAILTSIAGAEPVQRAAQLDPALQSRLVGRWTNPNDHVVVEIASIDLATGHLTGTETALASDQGHVLDGWVNDAPSRAGWDHVVPVTFATALHEYGTLPVWAGFLRGDELVTMHYLVWPTRPYAWEHVSTGQETWTRLPGAGEWRSWPRDRKRAHMEAIVAADARTMFTLYDAKRFSTMTCKGCHGNGADSGDFKMPNAALPQLDATPDGFRTLERDHGPAVAFMRQLTERTADLLGEPRFSADTGKGFGCFACHVAKKAGRPKS